MPVTHNTVVYDIHDAKLYPLTADVVGSAPTYGAAIDVPGIFSVSMDPNFVSAELKGDASVIAKKGRLDKFTLSLQYSKLSLDVMRALFGGTIADTGTDPNEKATYVYTGGTSIPSFGLGLQMQDVDAGITAVQVMLYKCQVTGGTILGQQSDQFGQPTFDVDAFSLEGTPTGGVAATMMKAAITEAANPTLPTDPNTF